MGDVPVATLRPNGSTACSSTLCIFYVHTDQLNAPRKITRPSDNKLAWRWDPNAFGVGTPNQNPASLGTFVYNLRYPGQYFQSETSLNYNYARDYDPSTGRYVEADPIGLAGGSLSMYAYANANPVSVIDPSGTNVSMTCGPLTGPLGIGGVLKHCGVVVWHWSEDCPPKKIIDRQFSNPGFSTTPTSNPQNLTYQNDQIAFYNPGGTNTNYDIPVPGSMTSTQFDSAVIATGSGFSNPIYIPWGPNSNTAATEIISGAGGTVPNVPLAVGQWWPYSPAPTIPRF
jgi:RHS repeat-associated protein